MVGSTEDKIKELEELISKTEYNKRTQKAIGLYKAQIAKLREKQASAGKKGSGEGYSVRKTGDGTVVLLGFPSVGKSTLLNGLTDANSEVASYAFTTLTVIPGIMQYNHAKIQILDVPGVVHGAATGRGRGTEVFSVLRSADLILILIDVHHPEHHEALLKELIDAGIRINTRQPDVKIAKKSRGGIKISRTVKLTKIDEETIEGILRAFRISNADVVVRTDISDDEFIDCIEGNRKYVPAITVLNKIDMVQPEQAKRIGSQIKADLLVSAERKEHLDELRQLIFERLGLIRIYMKEPGKEADLNVPLIIFKGSTVRDVCSKLHKDFVRLFKFCRIWGRSAKFPGQKLSLKHIMADGDVLEIHLR